MPNATNTHYTDLKHQVQLTIHEYMMDSKEENREKLICAAMLTGMCQAAEYIANNNCPPNMLAAVCADVAKGWGLKENA